MMTDPISQTPFPNQQKNKWNKEAGYDKYDTKVYTPDEVGASNRAEAKQWEQQNTNRLDSEDHPLDRQQNSKPETPNEE